MDARSASRWRLSPWLLMPILVVAWVFRHEVLLSWVRRDHSVGVDVSHHQGRIDWEKVRGAGVAFAYIKATEGVTFTDPAFAANWSQAGAAGVRRGAYHFFTFCTRGRDQAAHFVDVVPAEADTLPPLVDLELEGNCDKRPSIAELTAELEDFLRIVELRHRRRAILYVTKDIHARYGVVTRDHELFVREPFARPRWLAGKRWLFWQFDDGGRLDGIEGEVDLDAFSGSTEQLRALASAPSR